MRKLSTALLITGILIMLSPVAGRIYTRYQENRMIAEWLESSEDDLDAILTEDIDPEEAYAQLQQSFDIENTARQEGESGSQTSDTTAGNANEEGGASGQSSAPTAKPASKPAVQQTVLGVITINKIKVKYPIVEGVKEVNLRVGIGHIPGTAMPGQPGNCALAGHRNYTFGKFFNRLDEIDIGDSIMISTKQSDYKYVVYEKTTVTPDDVSVLKGSKKDNIITLITCTPIYIASHRLIVKARLESSTAPDP